MRRSEQMIVVGVVVFGLLLAFWLLILSPKRNEATDLQDQIDQLHSSLADAQQQVTAGEQARKAFGVDYRRLVVLGKAVPADSDQASLLVQLQSLADKAGVQFQSIDLGAGDSTATAAAAPTAPTTSTDTAGSTSTDTSTTSSDTASTSSTDPSAVAPASEAAASTLPIGASVGPAGLPVMPYDLTFKGAFFQIADFMKRLDGMVHTRDGSVDVQGRLLTVDAFTLTPADTGAATDPQLTANLNVTTYLTPADQGVTAGATPTGPTSSTPTLVSSTSTTPTAASDPASAPSDTSTTSTTAP